MNFFIATLQQNEALNLPKHETANKKMYKNMKNLQYIIQFLTNTTFACYGGEGVDLTAGEL
jgi:hypothetical protein